MKRGTLFLLAGVGLCLTGLRAGAATVSDQIVNLTLSGGDPIFSVTSDVTFTNLALTESFGDGSVVPIPLGSTSLDTTTLILAGASFDSGAHGGLQFVTLTGTLSLSDLGIQTSFGGPVTPVTVNPNFTAILQGSQIGASAPINVFDQGGTAYAVGSLGLTQVPEPGTVALLTTAGVCALFLLRRRAVRA